MTSDLILGTRGANITPSARPSIHAHNNCPFSSPVTMTSYGWRDEIEDELPIGEPSAKQGIDVPDCVFKEMPNNIVRTPSPARAANNKRRSYSNPQTTDDESDERRSSQRSPLRINDSYSNDSSSSRSPPHSNNSSPRMLAHQDEKQINKTSPLLILLGTLVSVTIAYCYKQLANEIDYYDQTKFYNDLNNLGKQHKISDDSILQVQSGVSTIFRKEDTGAFIFLYDSGKTNFDRNEFDYFIDDVANKAAKFLRNNSESVQYTAVEGSNLDMETHGELIKKYRGDVTKTGVMLVKELDKVPATLAMAFHYYCDEYNPLVKKSAIFFTLDKTNCSNKSAKESSIHAYVENCLSSKWLEVPKEQMGPLLTRIVNIVVNVNTNQ